MTTAYTSLLGLALPVTGELSGTWGDTVNNSITSLLDTAVAGTTTISTDGDVTLTTTTGASNQARQAIILCSGARTALRTITAPAQSKIYTIINATTGGYSVKLVGSGPTTGLTIPNGASATVAWNGSDFIEIGSSTIGNLVVNGTLTVTGATTLQSTLSVTGAGTIQGLTVGKGAGAVSTNTAVGASALAANTSGSDNTSIGSASLTSNTSGTANTALGRAALLLNTAGSDNTGLGYWALSANTTGNYNVAVGRDSLKANTTASNNTAVGYQAVYSNVTGLRITALGSSAGYSSTATDAGVFIGNSTGYSNTTGQYNVAVGGFDSTTYPALYSNTTGAYNTALGAGSLAKNTTASNNTAVGYQAGYSATGANAVSIGYQAGYQNLTGNYSVSVGYQALYGGASADIDRAVAIGAFALKSDTTGDYNVAVGYEALQANTTASYNTAVGYQAGYAVTTGQYNTIIGEEAGKTATTASNNTFLGQAAGYNATGGRNTFLGIGAGSQVTSGASNTIIGNFSGNQGGLDIRTSNNYIVLSDGDGNPRGIFDGSGNFLVGKTATSGATLGAELRADGSAWSAMSASANATSTINVYSTGASAYRFYVGMGGTIYATSTTITAISDQRLKENIQDIDVGLDAVMALKPRKFDWKAGKGKNKKGDRGWIAQEFEQVFPDMIDTWRDPAPEGEEPYKAVNADLIPILVKAIQELKAEFDAYKATHP